MLFAEIYTIGVFAVGLSHFRFTRSGDDEDDEELDEAAARALRYSSQGQSQDLGHELSQDVNQDLNQQLLLSNSTPQAHAQSQAQARTGGPVASTPPPITPLSPRRARPASSTSTGTGTGTGSKWCACLSAVGLGALLERLELLVTRYMLTINLGVQVASLLLLLAVDSNLLLRAESLANVGADGTTWRGATLTDHALLALILLLQALLFAHLMAASWRLVKRLQSNALGVVFLLKVHVSVLLLFAGLYMAVFLLMGPDSFFLFPLPAPDGSNRVLSGSPADLPVLFFQCVYFSVREYAPGPLPEPGRTHTVTALLAPPPSTSHSLTAVCLTHAALFFFTIIRSCSAPPLALAMCVQFCNSLPHAVPCTHSDFLLVYLRIPLHLASLFRCSRPPPSRASSSSAKCCLGMAFAHSALPVALPNLACVRLSILKHECFAVFVCLVVSASSSMWC
jgi:hypothetical protein